MNIEPSSFFPGLKTTVSVVSAPESIVGLIVADYGIFSPKLTRNNRKSTRSNIFILSEMSSEENEIEPEKATIDSDSVRGSARSWIFETSKASSNGSVEFTSIVPQEITSWSLFAVSIHPDFGFQFSDYSQVTVVKEFFIKVNLPSTVRYGEIFKVDVLIFNFSPAQVGNSEVVVTLSRSDESEDFEHMEKISHCKFVSNDEDEYEKHLSVAKNSIQSVSFLIRPIQKGAIKLNFKASEKISGAYHEVEKVLNVEHEGIAKFLKQSILVDLRKEKSFSHRFEISIPSNAVWKSLSNDMSIVGDLLGPAILNATILM